MTIGQTVRERRRARGLSQEQLGQRVGVTLSAIQRLESGRIQDPHYSTLSGIARALDTTVAELTGESAPLVASPPPGQPSRAEQVAQDAAERAQRLTEDVPRRMQEIAERMASGAAHGQGVSSSPSEASQKPIASSEASALLAYFLAAGLLSEDDIEEAREALRRRHASRT